MYLFWQSATESINQIITTRFYDRQTRHSNIAEGDMRIDATVEFNLLGDGASGSKIVNVKPLSKM